MAATCGTPLITVFAGFASDRMFLRWQPTGAGPAVVLRVDDQGPEEVLRTTVQAANQLLADSAT